MSRTNLLAWRRKKLSQRSVHIIATSGLLFLMIVTLSRMGMHYYQQRLNQFDTLNSLYQHLITQISQRIQQQQLLLRQRDQFDIEHRQALIVKEQLLSYRLFFEWLAEHLPGHTWLTALTVSQSGWMITGQSLSLKEIEKFIQQLLGVKQISGLSLNDLKKQAEYYQFIVTFMLLAEKDEGSADGR